MFDHIIFLQSRSKLEDPEQLKLKQKAKEVSIYLSLELKLPIKNNVKNKY